MLVIGFYDVRSAVLLFLFCFLFENLQVGFI